LALGTGQGMPIGNFRAALQRELRAGL
jgi:hypothetical protein